MKHTQLVFIIGIVLMIFNCSSSKIVKAYKAPETDVFQANKVLVVGVNSNTTIRKLYESKLTKALRDKGVDAVESVYFFEDNFINKKQSKSDLNKIEAQLLGSGFDAILVTKVVGKRAKVTLMDSYRSFNQMHNTFGDYYYSNQHLFSVKDTKKNTKYFSETALYCICPDKERELLWKGDITINSAKPEKIIKDYTNLLIDNLSKNKLLILK